MKEIYSQYKDQAEFLTVYIKEAHPTDEWQMPDNETDKVCYSQPRTTGQRVAIANDFVKRFEWPLPLVVDPIENPANELYAGWPERLYVVDAKGVIVYKGGQGPFHYDPEELAEFLGKTIATK